jgi:hypothetical protein
VLLTQERAEASFSPFMAASGTRTIEYTTVFLIPIGLSVDPAAFTLRTPLYAYDFVAAFAGFFFIFCH